MKPWLLVVLIVAALLDLLLAGATLSAAGFATEGGVGNRITPSVVIALAIPAICLLCAVAGVVLVLRGSARAGLIFALAPIVLALVLAPWLAF